MYQLEPNILKAYLDHGLACVVIGGIDEHLVGFVKADPIVKQNDLFLSAADNPKLIFHQIANGEAALVAFEVGSRVVAPPYQGKGLGTQLKQLIAESIASQFPGIPIFSVVASDNKPSIKSNMNAGWMYMTEEELKNQTDGLGIFDDWTQQSVIFQYIP